jgi:hypothetical protein
MVSYDTIHKQLVHGSFIVGLREDINKHVTILNVATLNYIVLQFRLLKQNDYFGSMFIFGLSSIFGGSCGSIENWLDPKTKPPLGNLACPNP